MYLVRIYLTFLLHMYRTTRPGGATTVQLRSKLPHILRIICTHTSYRKPHRILRIRWAVGAAIFGELARRHRVPPKVYVWHQ
jgi:hypothetical protein